MGLDANGLRFVLYAKRSGVEFARTAMIGRQGLYVNRQEIRASLAQMGFPCGRGETERILTASDHYADELFRFLGARHVDAYDNSAYEGATCVHDMNTPIAPASKGRYTAVLDGGSLEHVFNFPVALKNCMEMVEVGGHYLAISPGNNLAGHGFYQFSPELYFSVFTDSNGFRLKSVLAFEDRPDARWYSVKSPVSVKRRVTLTNSRPVYLLVIAERTANIEPLRSTPQQSDYVQIWNSRSGVENPDRVGLGGNVKPRHPWIVAVADRAPLSLIRLARWVRRPPKNRAGFNAEFFEPFDPSSV